MAIPDATTSAEQGEESRGDAILCGLGNPGERYRNTRHNLGFLLLDLLERRWKLRADAGRGDYMRAEGEIEGRRILLIRPLTYMNLSGRAVKQALSLETLRDPRLLVLVDDVALPLGTLRQRARGSAGGHNGLRSIESSLGTPEYARLRMGCGPAPEDEDLAEFVLSEFDREQWGEVEEMLERAAEVVHRWVLEGTENSTERPGA